MPKRNHRGKRASSRRIPSPFEGVLAKVLLLCTHDPELSQLRETGRYPPIDDI